jgi:hypothetical protein
MRLTDEQAQIVDAARSEECLVVEAGAGTGKTTTLVAVAKSRPRQKGLLTVFNRLMAETTNPRLAGTSCSARTLHSVAYGSDVAAPFRRDDGKRLASMLPAKTAASAAGLDMGLIQIGDVDLTPYDTGDILKDWVTRYCQSEDDHLGLQHFPRGTLLDALSVQHAKRAREEPQWFNLVVDDVARNLIKGAKKLWELMSDPEGTFLSSADVYLKLFAMSRPRFDLDYMVLDEAQDANPVMLQILNGARQQGVQTIFVGDSHQQMYSWRGAVDAIRSVRATKRLQLTQSFRFGRDVAAVANGVLGEMIQTPFRIQGVGGPSRIVGGITVPNAVICRTNATAISGAIDAEVYGMRPGLCLNKDSILKEIDAIEDLRLKGRCTLRRFAKFQSYDDLMLAVESGDAPDIKVLMSLIKKIGVSDTKNAIARIAVGKDQKQIERANLDTLYLTAHAAKGLEFDHVLLASDFKGLDKEGNLPAPEEANGLYVAVTRAQSTLCLGDSNAAKLLLDRGLVPTSYLHERIVGNTGHNAGHGQTQAGTGTGCPPVATAAAEETEKPKGSTPKKKALAAVQTPSSAQKLAILQWDGQDEQKIWSMWHSGASIDDLSKAVNKSTAAVLMRLSAMMGCTVQDLVVESLRRETGQTTPSADPKDRQGGASMRRAQVALF